MRPETRFNKKLMLHCEILSKMASGLWKLRFCLCILLFWVVVFLMHVVFLMEHMPKGWVGVFRNFRKVTKKK